jgi:hypothetical protein
MPQGQVRPLRLRSRNAEAVKGHQIVVMASGREPPRGDLAVKPTFKGYGRFCRNFWYVADLR